MLILKNFKYFEFDVVGSPSFDPSITTSDAKAGRWEFGDGTIANSATPTKVYADTNTYHVRYFVRELNRVTVIDMNTDGITGTVDLSLFVTLGGNFRINTNPQITSLINPISSQVFISYYAYGLAITSLDLSGLTALAGDIRINSNTSLASLINPITSGIITKYYCYGNTSLTAIDISGFSAISGEIRFYSCSVITTIVNAISSGIISLYWAFSCPLLTSIDLSGYTGLGGSVLLYGNTAMTSITNPSSNQTFSAYYAYNCPNLGYIDFTTLTNILNSNNAFIAIDNNNWTDTIVNQILIDLDGMCDNSYTGRRIDINGTNAAPTGAGITAKDSLIAKNIIVNI